jgi:hypothetical protein
MVNCCPSNCQTCYLNTQILVTDELTCQGIFTFGPDAITIPGPCGLTGLNTTICPLDVNVLENCKGDYKLTLLDDNGCSLDCIILRCSQFELVDVSAAVANNQALEDLYPVGYNKIFQINANNLNLVGEYIAFEEAAYFYRRVTQSYLNLWCGAERNGMICQLLENAQSVEATLADPDIADDAGAAQFVYNVVNDLLKARVVALKQLCECGKVCNDQFFPVQTNPCQALKGCCPPRHH